MNNIQYKETVAKKLVKDGYYTNLKDAMKSVEGMLKTDKNIRNGSDKIENWKSKA